MLFILIRRNQYLITRSLFLSQEINSYDKKLKERNPFLFQEILSCHKKSILVARNQFLTQEINSSHKKSFLVSSYPSVKLINSRQCVNPTKNSWEPGSQVPSEFAALL